jgi:hypothetical protein
MEEEEEEEEEEEVIQNRAHARRNSERDGTNTHAVAQRRC